MQSIPTKAVHLLSMTCSLTLMAWLMPAASSAQEQQDIAKQRSILQFDQGSSQLVPADRTVVESADDPQAQAFVAPKPPLELQSDQDDRPTDFWKQSNAPGSNAKVSLELDSNQTDSSIDQSTFTSDQDESTGSTTSANGTFASNPMPQEGRSLLAPAVNQNLSDSSSGRASEFSPPSVRQDLTAPPMQDSSKLSPFVNSGNRFSSDLRPADNDGGSEGGLADTQKSLLPPRPFDARQSQPIGGRISDQIGDEANDEAMQAPSIPSLSRGGADAMNSTDPDVRSEPMYDTNVQTASFQDNGFGPPPAQPVSRPATSPSRGFPQPATGQANGLPNAMPASQRPTLQDGFAGRQPAPATAGANSMGTRQTPGDMAKAQERQRLMKLRTELRPARDLIARYNLSNYQTYPGTPVSLEEMMSQPISMQKREAMTHQYWETYYDWAALNVAREHQAWANSLQAGSPADTALVETARKAANDRVLAAEIQMGKSQSRLLDYFADARSDDFLPLPGDAPTVDPFKTDLATYRKIRTIPSSLRGIEQMLNGTMQLMVQRAATVSSAQRSRAAMQQAAMGRQATIASTLVAAEICRNAELDLVASVVNYNQAIGHYLLTMEPYRTPQQLVTWMIGAKNQKTKMPNVARLGQDQRLNPNSQPASLADAGQSILATSNSSQSSQAMVGDAPVGSLADLPWSDAATQGISGGSNLARGNPMQRNPPQGIGRGGSTQNNTIRGASNPGARNAFADTRPMGGGGQVASPQGMVRAPRQPSGGFGGGGFQNAPPVQPGFGPRTAQGADGSGNTFR